MKKRLAALIVACACVLCLGLVGCSGGGGDSAKEAAKNFVGTWELSGGTLDGEKIAAEDIEMMSAFDLTITVTMTEDGKATLDMMGEKMEGTWKAKDATTASLDFDGSKGDVKYDNGKITLKEGSDEMEFTKKKE